MKHTVEQEMASINMEEVLRHMIKYARDEMRNINYKQLDGIEEEDIVSDVIMKVMDGVRRWDTAKTNNFKEFLFGCLRSDISNLKKKLTRRNIGIFTYICQDTEYNNGFDSKSNPRSYNNDELKERYYKNK